MSPSLSLPDASRCPWSRRVVWLFRADTGQAWRMSVSPCQWVVRGGRKSGRRDAASPIPRWLGGHWRGARRLRCGGTHGERVAAASGRLAAAGVACVRLLMPLS